MEPTASRAEAPTRRRFLQTLGAASALPFAGALPAAAQPPPIQPPPAPAPETPRPAPVLGSPPLQPSAAEDESQAADAANLLDIVQRRYGEKWTPAEVFDLRADIRGNVGAGRVLRQLPLRNADEPDTVFRALPLEE